METKFAVRARPPAFNSRYRFLRCRRASFSTFLLVLVFTHLLAAQQPPTIPRTDPGAMATLTGTVKDPAGYLIPHAQITLTAVPTATSGSSAAMVTTSDDAGVFRLAGLAVGSYSLLVQATGFALIQQNLVVTEPRGEGHAQRIDVTLPIPTAEMQVSVGDEGDDTAPEHNGSAIVLRPADLNILSDDPDTMKQQLEAIAGPSTDGAHFYIDGFEGTRLPPKSDIREIRINSNLYSAQYDTPGQARIEIFTKPGAGTLHGGLWGNYSNSILNAQDPIATQPAYSHSQLGGYLSGPLGKHLASNANFSRNMYSDSSFVKATVLDGLNVVALTQAIPNKRTQIYFDPRIDFQGPFHTAISLRYIVSHEAQAVGGVGGLVLASEAYRLDNTSQTMQMLATKSFGAKTVNELRFQYTRTRNNEFAASTAPTINVQGAFNGGGAPGGTTRDNQDTYELQDYFSHVFKKSFLRAGGRLRILRDASDATSGFNGAYTFATIGAYQLTLQGIAQGLTPAQIRASGGGASLFSLSVGTPKAKVSRVDGAVYVEDDWKVTPKFTASIGLRVESQTVISDHFDVAPRISLAYAVGPKGKPARFTLRAGSGIFYQRFSTGSQLRIARGNGVVQQQYQVENPDFYPLIPSPAALGASVPPAITQMDPNLRAPYSVFSGLGIDHPFGKVANLSVNYTNTHLVHAFEMRNINAPMPGSGVRPYGGTNAIYEYGSEGLSNQQSLRINSSYRKGPISFYTYYSLSFNDSNTNGGFPSNSYDQHVDYGRAANDIRHQMYAYLNADLPFKIHTSTNAVLRSGAPFNITVGQDLNGDTQYNDRPTYATDLTRASVVTTRWGVFDTQPIAGQKTIPINLGTAPASLQVDQRLSRSFNFGPKLPDAPKAAGAKTPAKPVPVRRRYSFDAYVYAVNVLNHANYTNPSGVLIPVQAGQRSTFGIPTADQGARALLFGGFFSF
ncbi:Outer membrane receptor proteins, mostly Fe transport [Granulicella pectinivorans]|uniref:Outer membrane receptor proteins, mostly Fe transport n=1 Tax=Granulicella pectinivorans TaxID=474950 RepID=A0A1I6MZB3_9BACT|nr:Outer membrane receptor proteins, mostly Fe transport [Granulicella pectinivorans]